MKNILGLLFLLSLFFVACSDTAEVPEESSVTEPSSSEGTVEVKRPGTFIVGLDYFRVRDAPGEKGNEIASLKQGDIVEETGEVSDFTTRIKLRGIWHDEPWVKIRTADGVEGWVFAGGLIFDDNDASALSQQLLRLRLISFFGEGLNDRIGKYRTAYHSAKTSTDFASVYKEGKSLRDTMVTILEEKIDVSSMDYEKLPDLFWIEQGLPGYETALVAEGTIYYLFQNFKTLKKQANRTSGKEDDDFMDLQLKVHAVDSIEYFFPSWFLQTWDYGGHSLLGQGKHLSILKTAEQNLKRSPMFMDETLRIKNEVIDDITRKSNTYWESKDKILKELDDIFAANLSILSKDDIIALQTRRQQFENAKANGIQINQRTGE